LLCLKKHDCNIFDKKMALILRGPFFSVKNLPLREIFIFTTQNPVLSMKKMILLVAVAIVFVRCNKKPATPDAAKPVASTETAIAAGMAAAKIAFVNIDSLQEKYTWFKQKKSEFEQKEKNLTTSLQNKAEAFQNEYAALQQKAQGGTVPPAQLQQEGERMQQKQQGLVAERDRKTKDLMDETQKFNADLMKKINTVLETLQKDKGFDYVIRHSRESGSAFLYVNEKLDITNEVLAILNAEKK
jgi:outer membrane protein